MRDVNFGLRDMLAVTMRCKHHLFVSYLCLHT